MQQATHIQRPPRIGQPWPNADGSSAGIYAGIAGGQDGADDYHLVLCTDIPASRLSWPDALAWAQGLGCNLPNRSEAALLFANLRSAHSTLRPAWTIDPPDGAPVLWLWEVGYDCQRQDNNKTVLAHARAVRRFNFLSLGTADDGQQASTSQVNPADRRFYVAHPSRTAPRCKNCKHFDTRENANIFGPVCFHPAAPINPVYGIEVTKASAARSARLSEEAICGPEGRLFEAVDSAS